MTVHLIEPGLVARTGHYFDYCMRMAASLQARGLSVAVHAQQAAMAEVGVAFTTAGVPFDASLPATMLAAPRGPSAAVDDLNWLRQPQQWLTQLAASALPQDLWLFPTLQAASLFALSRLIQSPPVVGFVHTPPRVSLWQPAAAALQLNGRHCRLLAIDPMVAELTQAHSGGLPVAVAPIPHGRWLRKQPADRIRRVGFFGHQRPERGMNLLQPLVTALLRRGLQVLVHDSRGRVSTQSPVPELELVSGYVDDLPALVARCDLVICPMDRQAYRHRSSGVVTEALACGVPVVLPAGTLVAERWAQTGAIQTYDEHTPEGILRGVDLVCNRALAFGQSAQQAAQSWDEQHGVERFVDVVLSS